MSQSLFSSSWYRVAELRPRLRSHAQVHRHVYRGSVWYVLQNHSTGKFHRFTPVANAIIGLMDGKRTVQEIWDLAATRLGDDLPSQDEVIKLLAELHKADVLQSNAPPDAAEIQQRRRRLAHARWKQYIGNPLSLRFPLFDPDSLLERAMPLVRPFAGWLGAAAWVGAVAWALVLGAMNWRALSGDMVDRVFAVENLLLLWFVFPGIKLLHEVGHALATKLRGGEVHEMGVMLLVLMPVPYVDASAATAFADKRSRMLVGSAGMLVELFIAAIAMVAWTYLEPGTGRSIAYNVVLVAGVSTLLFNGNPLLRYDGYYILADYLEIPNLGQRANEYLGYLANRYLFGLEGGSSPASAPGEERWFFFYGIGSFAYRMFMMVGIAVLVASRFFVIGVLLAFWAVATMLVLPLGKKLHYLFFGAQLASRRMRALATTGAMAFVAAIAVAWLPAPSATRAEGVVWAPDQAQIRATVDGFVTEVLAKPGQRVEVGDVLFRSEDAELKSRARTLRAQLAELDARYDAANPTRRVQADVIAEQRAHMVEALRLAERRQKELEIRSPVSGVFAMQDAANAPGRFVQRGEVLAFVLDESASRVRVVVPQAEGDFVGKHTEEVEIRSAGRIGEPQRARILREVPAATDELPSMTLSLQGGGTIGLDPGKPTDPRALEKLFVLDLELPSAPKPVLIGGRVYVRFQHPPEPLASQWYRSIRRSVLRRFNV